MEVGGRAVEGEPGSMLAERRGNEGGIREVDTEPCSRKLGTGLCAPAVRCNVVTAKIMSQSVCVGWRGAGKYARDAYKPAQNVFEPVLYCAGQ